MARLHGEGVRTWEGGVYRIKYRKDAAGHWKIRRMEYDTLSRADYRGQELCATDFRVALCHALSGGSTGSRRDIGPYARAKLSRPFVDPVHRFRRLIRILPRTLSRRKRLLQDWIPDADWTRAVSRATTIRNVRGQFILRISMSGGAARARVQPAGTPPTPNT